ncbi:hypothetical protein BD414DRAFT_482623, partial [Trametes punicea]
MSNTEAAGSLDLQRERVSIALQNLKSLISLIPEAAPVAAPDGPIARNFSDLDVSSEEGPYYALDKAWVRTFQVPQEEQERLVCRGEYGLEYLFKCLLWFSELPAMTANDGLFLLGERIEALNTGLQMLELV